MHKKNWLIGIFIILVLFIPLVWFFGRDFLGNIFYSIVNGTGTCKQESSPYSLFFTGGTNEEQIKVLQVLGVKNAEEIILSNRRKGFTKDSYEFNAEVVNSHLDYLHSLSYVYLIQVPCVNSN